MKNGNYKKYGKEILNANNEFKTKRKDDSKIPEVSRFDWYEKSATTIEKKSAINIKPFNKNSLYIREKTFLEDIVKLDYFESEYGCDCDAFRLSGCCDHFD